MIHLCVNERKEFVSLIMISYMTDYRVTLEFSALYTLEHNSVAEQCW